MSEAVPFRLVDSSERKPAKLSSAAELEAKRDRIAAPAVVRTRPRSLQDGGFEVRGMIFLSSIDKEFSMDRILKLQELPTYSDQQPGDSTQTSGSTSSCNACVCETIPTAV